MIEDPVERALKWAEEQKEKQKALKALEEAKPKVETYDALVSRESYVGIREMAKLIGYPVNKMGAYLVQIGMVYRDKKTNTSTSQLRSSVPMVWCPISGRLLDGVVEVTWIPSIP